MNELKLEGEIKIKGKDIHEILGKLYFVKGNLYIIDEQLRQKSIILIDEAIKKIEKLTGINMNKLGSGKCKDCGIEIGSSQNAWIEHKKKCNSGNVKMNELREQFEKETGKSLIEKIDGWNPKNGFFKGKEVQVTTAKYTEWLESKLKEAKEQGYWQGAEHAKKHYQDKLKSQKEKIIDIIHSFCKRCPLHKIIIKQIEEL